MTALTRYLLINAALVIGQRLPVESCGQFLGEPRGQQVAGS